MRWMQQGLHYHQSGQWQEAQKCYEQSLLCQQDNYETLQLFGALLYKLGDAPKALEYLHSSLLINPQQAHVINTLGNVYKSQNDVDNAINQYQNAIALKSDYIDPYINLVQLYISLGNWEACTPYVDAGESHIPNHWQWLRLRALLHREQGHFNQSVQYLSEANRLLPNQLTIIHDLALSYRLAGQAAKAVEFYAQLDAADFESEVFFHNYGNALSDIGDHDTALEYYSKALNINPIARDTLLNWCDLMWESGQGANMFIAYGQAIKDNKATAVIYSDYLKKLLRTDTLDIAEEVMAQMQRQFPGHALTQLRKIALFRTKKDFSSQYDDLNIIVNDPSIALEEKLEAIEYLLERGEYELSLTFLQYLQEKYPDDQWLLSLLHTCSRLLPTCAHIFPKIEDYVFEFSITPPPGLSHESFIVQLSEYLLSLHSSQEQPLEQTLHEGTQTRGNLFDLSHPLLDHVQSEYLKAVAEYRTKREHLPELYPGFWDDGVPEFSGSWSVALRQNGYHNYHIHPMGWLSSALYIVLPDIKDDNNEGYFQVGVPNLAHEGLNLKPLRAIKPEVGKLVLFPSMLWHGTVPFSKKDLRLSVACDIVRSDVDKNHLNKA